MTSAIVLPSLSLASPIMWNSLPALLSRMVPPGFRSPPTVYEYSFMVMSTASAPLATAVVAVVVAVVASSSLSSPHAASPPVRAMAMKTAAVVGDFACFLPAQKYWMRIVFPPSAAVNHSL